MEIPFSKYCGAGNDFILIDNRTEFLSVSSCSSLTRSLCNRTHGIGGDGLVLLQNSDLGAPFADYKMRIFNCDGSEAEMCGNGLRCFGKFLKELGIAKSSFTIETPLARQKIHRIEFVDEDVVIEMRFPQLGRSVFLPEHEITVDYLDTGVPQVVHFVDDVESVDVARMGSSIRYHPAFYPKGTNVNFAAVTSHGIFLRTYERGVEGETLACGTGACATALAAAKKYHLNSPISLTVRSKDTLTVDFSRDEKGRFSKVFMTGPTQRTFHGNFQLEDFLLHEYTQTN